MGKERGAGADTVYLFTALHHQAEKLEHLSIDSSIHHQAVFGLELNQRRLGLHIVYACGSAAAAIKRQKILHLYNKLRCQGRNDCLGRAGLQLWILRIEKHLLVCRLLVHQDCLLVQLSRLLV